MRIMLKRYKRIILLLVFILLVIGAIFIINFKINKLTRLEKIKLTEVSDEISLYLEYVEGDIDLDSYIIFALEYNYLENNDTTLTLDEVKEIVEKYFDVSLENESLESFGINPDMFEKNITYEYGLQEYTINVNDLTQSEIANIAITKYNLVSMNKKNNKYTLTYTKYVVENPYEVLNYYNNLEDSNVNTSDILNYLTGKDNVNSIKKYINSDNISSIGYEDKSIEVTFVIKNDSVLIQNIK